MECLLPAAQAEVGYRLGLDDLHAGCRFTPAAPPCLAVSRRSSNCMAEVAVVTEAVNEGPCAGVLQQLQPPEAPRA